MRLILPGEVFGRDLFSEDTWFGQLGALLTLFTLLGGIVVVFVRWWWWRTQEFLVTNRRLVLAWGVLNKSSSDSSLEKINDAQLEISVLGRLLDYGTLKVMTAAPMAGSDYLDRLWHAKDFKKVMMTAKHDLETGGFGTDIAMSRSAPPVATAPAAVAAASGIDVSGGIDPLKPTRLTRSPPCWRSWLEAARRRPPHRGRVRGQEAGAAGTPVTVAVGPAVPVAAGRLDRPAAPGRPVDR